ncbi:unnamed protein product, partial [Prunus brigantina]
MDGCVALLTSSQAIDRPSKEPPLGLDSFTFSGKRMIRFRMDIVRKIHSSIYHTTLEFSRRRSTIPVIASFTSYIIRPQGSYNSQSPVTFVRPKTPIAPVAQETLRPNLPYLDFHCGRILASHASAAFQPHFDIEPGRYFQLQPHLVCPAFSSRAQRKNLGRNLSLQPLFEQNPAAILESCSA